MNALHGSFGILIGVALASCGGSAPPPQTEGTKQISSANAPVESTGAVSDAPASPELIAGIKAFDAGNFAEARKSFEAAAKKNPNDYQGFFNLGMACEKLGDKAAAEGAYKSALAIKPDVEPVAAELSALYVDQGRIDDALAVGRSALAKHPTNASLHENVGVALATRGEQENAVREFELAIKGQPSEPMFQLTFAHWLSVWRAPGAAAHLEAARDLAKSDYAMIASVGHEYRMAGEFDACIKTFDRAIQIKDAGEVRTERALCKHGSKDENGTLDDLQAAVTKEPTYAPAHYYLGGRFALLKRYKEAAAEYAKYLELAPDGSLSKQAGERLRASQDAAKAAAKKK